MPDRVTAVQQVLLASPTVAALVGVRVYAFELPDVVVRTMPKVALVVQPAGGLGAVRSMGNYYSDRRVDVRAYGWKGVETAHTLATTVAAALEDMPRTRINDTLLHWCRLAGGPTPLREPAQAWPGAEARPVDPTRSWPCVLTSYQVMAADIPAPVAP